MLFLCKETVVIWYEIHLNPATPVNTSKKVDNFKIKEECLQKVKSMEQQDQENKIIIIFFNILSI